MSRLASLLWFAAQATPAAPLERLGRLQPGFLGARRRQRLLRGGATTVCSERDLLVHSYVLCLQDTSDVPVASRSHRGLQASTPRSDVGGRCPRLHTPGGQLLLGKKSPREAGDPQPAARPREGKPEAASTACTYRPLN